MAQRPGSLPVFCDPYMSNLQPSHRHKAAIAMWAALSLLAIALTIHGFVDLVADPGTRDWRTTSKYLVLFGALSTSIAVLARLVKQPPFSVAVGIGVLTVLASGVVGALLSALAITVTAYMIGQWVLPHTHRAIDRILAGTVIIGTAVGLTAAVPWHHAGIYGVALLVLLVLRRQQFSTLCHRIAEFGRSLPSADKAVFALHCLIGAATLLHLFVSLMPEIGHDALAMHLFIPATVEQRRAWNFDVEKYIWAAMPLLVDWVYTPAYLWGGETATRLVNFGGIVLVASLVQQTARWAGAGRKSALCAALLLLVTPLTFTESSSLFVESIWAALLIGGILPIARLASGQRTPSDLCLAAILLGGALAAKAVTLTILPILALLLGARLPTWWQRGDLRPFIFSLLVFTAIGMVPYATAFVLTGNPVYPFFNELFPATKKIGALFNAPKLYEQGIDWGTFYRITFHSGRFLEATPGAAGFQWLALIVPTALSVALLPARRVWALGLLTLFGIAVVFWQTAYLRYVFPFFALACAFCTSAISTILPKYAGWARTISLFVGASVVVLNLLHFHSGTYYGKISAGVMFDAAERRSYSRSATPVHAAIPLVNELNTQKSPVAFFSSPLVAGLRADSLHANWYNPGFSAAVYAAANEGMLARTLSGRSVEWIVVDEAWPQQTLRTMATNISSEIARVGTVSIRKLKDNLRFPDELLASPTFGQDGSWVYASGVERPRGGGVLVDVATPASTVVPIVGDNLYRYEATARCHRGPAQGRLQVNWLDTSGNLILPEIQVFSCTEKAETHAIDLKAPPSARYAVVFASGHESARLLFEKVSFRH